MQEISSYLNEYRETTPLWLEGFLHGGQVSFKDIMSSRVAYYPGSGYDGTLLKVGNMSHSVHSFLYVDYGIGRKDMEKHLAQPRSIVGYHPIGRFEWTEADMLPNGQYPLNVDKKPLYFDSATFVDPNEKPYCFSLIMERNKDQNDTRGAEHFVITFLFADGISTYYQLFVKEYSKAPWIVLLQDHGLGGNYDRFGRGGILDAIIQVNNCYPTFVLRGENTFIWKGYKKVKSVAPLFSSLNRNRRVLYKLELA